MESPTERKRRQLRDYIAREVASEAAVLGMVVVGSVATGRAGPGSDIDAVVFLDPQDLYAIPAEFQWRAADNSYHSIFVEVEDALQLDFKRVAWPEWAADGFDWPEPTKLELAAGWVAYDPTGQVSALIARKTAYPAELRRQRLDNALIWLDLLLAESAIQETWARLGPAAAHDRLNDAYDQLVGGVFAYHRAWRPWRSREQSYLADLAWLPGPLSAHLPAMVVPSNNSQGGYLERAGYLRQSFGELMRRCQADGLYSDDPVGEAFVRTHEEPGRSWNIATWVAQHAART